MPAEQVIRCSVLPTTLFRGLIFISLLAVLILPLYTFFFLSPSFVEFVIKSNKELATEIAMHMESRLIPADCQGLTNDILSRDVLEKIEGTARDFSITKVRIVFPDGRILYSTQADEVGAIRSRPEFRRTIGSGAPYAQLRQKGEQSLDGRTIQSDMVETFVPIRRAGRTIGIFEIFYDIGRKEAALTHLLHTLYFTLFPITMVLFSAVLLSCRRANRNIAARLAAEEALMRQREELKAKNEELTELFQVCQARQHSLEEAEEARFQAQEQVRQEMMKREQLRLDLLRHMVRAQEEERARIARELHDETAQTLTAASLNLAALQNLQASNPEMAEVVGRLQGLCKQMHRDLYRLVHDLRPAQLDDLGLVAALRYLVDEGQKNTGLNVSLNVSGNQRKLEPLMETIIYRFVQEGLTNVTRYAGTDHAAVALIYEDERVIARVKDQGRGFDPAQQSQTGRGWGLAGIAERAASLGGVFRIESAPGQGAMIEITIPMSLG